MTVSTERTASPSPAPRPVLVAVIAAVWWACWGGAPVGAAVAWPAGAHVVGSAETPAALASPRAAPAGTGYQPPVAGAVTRLFDPPAIRWGSGHRGVDLAATPGSEVRSPAAGVITFAGPVAGRGVVTVLHDDGLRSSLEPVEADVVPGDRVGPGTVVGTLQDRSGHDGVHWGVRDAGAYVDPLSLLTRTSPVVLLPPAG